MKILSMSPNFKLPVRGTDHSGAFDMYMPEAGSAHCDASVLVGLGFAAAIPVGYVALILPRSGVGAMKGLELNNTCGVIDSDYRGEWKAALKTKKINTHNWEMGERLLQFLIVPVHTPILEIVQSLPPTDRAGGGFGSTGV